MGPRRSGSRARRPVAAWRRRDGRGRGAAEPVVDGVDRPGAGVAPVDPWWQRTGAGSMGRESGLVSHLNDVKSPPGTAHGGRRDGDIAVSGPREPLSIALTDRAILPEGSTGRFRGIPSEDSVGTGCSRRRRTARDRTALSHRRTARDGSVVSRQRTAWERAAVGGGRQRGIGPRYHIGG